MILYELVAVRINKRTTIPVHNIMATICIHLTLWSHGDSIQSSCSTQEYLAELYIYFVIYIPMFLEERGSEGITSFVLIQGYGSNLSSLVLVIRTGVLVIRTGVLGISGIDTLATVLVCLISLNDFATSTYRQKSSTSSSDESIDTTPSKRII
jgi:hypothetical protein